MKPRIIVWFSCGAASAVAVRITIRMFGETHDVLPVCCDTRPSEHDDNYRFSKQCEEWFGRPITYIRNENYETVDDVFEQQKYMSGVKGAVCTTRLKKFPRLKFSAPDDLHVFGYTVEEKKRMIDFRMRNPDIRFLFILAACGISKQECYETIKATGIELPMMYRLFDAEDSARYGQAGFDNNNCPGCVKSSSPWYWSMIRKYFPDVFKRRCEQSRLLGVRLVEIAHHKRIFLDELPEKVFKKGRKENLSCGPECGAASK